MSAVGMLLFATLGVLAGSLSGLLGIGGGVILVPALVFIFGLSQHFAQGTTLALMVPPIGLLAAWQYYKHGHVNLRIAGLVCAGFIAGGLLGAQLAMLLSEELLTKVFSVALLLIALKILLSHNKCGANEDAAVKTKQSISTLRGFLLITLGLFAGGLSGLLGIGGGAILVPALVCLFRLPQHEAQGTTLALMVPPIGTLAAWQYYQSGDVNLPIAGLVCLGFFFGGLLGARLATIMSNRALAWLFGIAMLLIALKMWFS